MAELAVQTKPPMIRRYKPGTVYPVLPNHKVVLHSMGFTVGKVINVGNYGHVCEAKKDRLNIAVKILDCEELGKIKQRYVHYDLPRELKALQKLKHKYIIYTYKPILLDSIFYLFMEKAEGGDLFDMLWEHTQGLSEARAKTLYLGVAKALQYIHQMGFAHRDIKCENVLLVDSNKTIAKLTDFGAATACYEPRTGRRRLCVDSIGTAGYAAPEILLGQPYDAMKSDVFALGVVLYRMVNYHLPFSNNEIKQFNKSGHLKLKFIKHGLSNAIKDLISKQLEARHRNRIKMNQVVTHPWFK